MTIAELDTFEQCADSVLDAIKILKKFPGVMDEFNKAERMASSIRAACNGTRALKEARRTEDAMS